MIFFFQYTNGHAARTNGSLHSEDDKDCNISARIVNSTVTPPKEPAPASGRHRPSRPVSSSESHSRTSNGLDMQKQNDSSPVKHGLEEFEQSVNGAGKRPDKPEKPERKFNSRELIEKQKNWTSHFSKSRPSPRFSSDPNRSEVS